MNPDFHPEQKAFRMRASVGKRWAGVWLLLLVFGGIRAQPHNHALDSLRAINARYNDPAHKLDAILYLCQHTALNKFAERSLLADRGIYLAGVLKDSLKLGELYREKGLAYYFQGQLDSAAQYYYTAIRILETLPKGPQLGEAFNVLGRLYRKKREYARALDAYDRALALYTELGDSSGIGTIYNESGVVFEFMGNYTEAMRRYRTSLNIKKMLHDEHGVSYGLSNIGYLYITLKEYGQAEKYLKDALRIRVAMRDTFSMALNYSELGELYLKAGRYSEAAEQLRQSNAMAIPMGYPDLQMNNYKWLSEVALQQGNYREAFYRYRDYEILEDSIYRIESQQRIEEISTRYETEKKAGENELLKKTVSLREMEIRDRENQSRIQLITAISLGVIFFLAMLTGVLVFLRIRREQEIRLKEEVGSARDTERRRISRDLHDNLGAQMSYMIGILDKVSESGGEGRYVPVLRETAGQAIMTLRETVWAINRSDISVENFSDRFKQYARQQAAVKPQIELVFREEILDNRVLGPSAALNLYRLCQEAFSNALKHSGATRVEVTVCSDDRHEFYFSVADNGKGFDPEKDKKEGHYGLENMRSRAEEAGARFRIESEPGKGTRVEVFSPVAG